jgi:hypothetical protein
LTELENKIHPARRRRRAPENTINESQNAELLKSAGSEIVMSARDVRAQPLYAREHERPAADAELGTKKAAPLQGSSQGETLEMRATLQKIAELQTHLSYMQKSIDEMKTEIKDKNKEFHEFKQKDIVDIRTSLAGLQKENSHLATRAQVLLWIGGAVGILLLGFGALLTFVPKIQDVLGVRPAPLTDGRFPERPVNPGR